VQPKEEEDIAREKFPLEAGKAKKDETLQETPSFEKDDTYTDTSAADAQEENPATEKIADEAQWVKDLRQDLGERAEGEATDLRRAQLKMRADEKEKLEEERDAKQEQKKANPKGAPKPRGRPRRVEGEPQKKRPRKSDAGKEADSPEGDTSSKKEEPAAAKSDKRKRKSATNEEVENDDEVAQPKAKAKAKAKANAKAKAKAKAGAKRAPRSKGNLPPPDKVMEKEMVELMRRYKDKPYDKEVDVLHRIYTKKNSPKFYTSIYFGRPAGGVKIVFADGTETQKFYFSYAYSTVAVHIYACNKIISTFQNAEDRWWDGDEALALFQQLLITAASAQKAFDALDVD